MSQNKIEQNYRECAGKLYIWRQRMRHGLKWWYAMRKRYCSPDRIITALRNDKKRETNKFWQRMEFVSQIIRIHITQMCTSIRLFWLSVCVHACMYVKRMTQFVGVAVPISVCIFECVRVCACSCMKKSDICSVEKRIRFGYISQGRAWERQYAFIALVIQQI